MLVRVLLLGNMLPKAAKIYFAFRFEIIFTLGNKCVHFNITFFSMILLNIVIPVCTGQLGNAQLKSKSAHDEKNMQILAELVLSNSSEGNDYLAYAARPGNELQKAEKYEARFVSNFVCFLKTNYPISKDLF